MNSSEIIQPKTAAAAAAAEELNFLKNSLLQEPCFYGDEPLFHYQGFWTQSLDSITAFQKHFQAQDTDILISSFRKVGTTWLKALVFAICDRKNHPPSNSPLLTHNPHALVPQFESNIYARSKCPDLSSFCSPRLFGTHVPFPSLPTSIKNSHCKIIYMCRNPFDTFVSSWLFYLKIESNTALKPDMLAQFFDMFCQGKIPFGPFEDHVLGYWKQSLDQPHKVLFIKYEDLKADPTSQVKQLADFVGYPFSKEEEHGEVVDDIVKLCSFEKMKVAAASGKCARVFSAIPNELFFRKGITGDWVNYLTPSMVEKLAKIMEEKFRGTGLTLL